ncbi:hypothetical protein [Prevotella sp. P4-51]|uniref:hypothetical protein n=1 Tax=Prevotella sp. P4-51 TaxID=2024228 RepID=UPI001180571B|nr:hypothetical protein [Prevotella sp. P4-51]
MKKTLLFLIAATAMMMTGCSNDDFGGATQGMTLNATVEQPASRATMDEGEKGTYKFSFAVNDMLNVTNSQVESYYTFTKQGETFTSTNAQTTTAAADWYAYFPGNTVNLAGQTGDLAGVANYYACAGKTASATTGADGLNIRLTPQVAILRIKVDSIACDIQVKTSDDKWVSGLEATKGTTEFTVTTSNSKVSLLTKPEPGTYYIAVPAGVKIAIYNGGTLVRATKDKGLTAGKYYNLTTGPVSGKVEATIDGKKRELVDWVQLWAGGPKFATKNVDGTMTWTDANANTFWEGNWRVPTKEEMSGLLGKVDGDITFTTSTVKVEYLQENNEFGFKFTGVQPGYTRNSIFLPLVNAKNYGTEFSGNYWSSYQDNESKSCSCLSLYYNVKPYLQTFILTTAHGENAKYAVRPVLK